MYSTLFIGGRWHKNLGDTISKDNKSGGHVPPSSYTSPAHEYISGILNLQFLFQITL